MSDEVQDRHISGDDEQAHLVRALVSRRKLLVAGSGIGVAGLAAVAGALPAGAAATAERSGSVPPPDGGGPLGAPTSGLPAGSPPAVTASLAPSVVPGTVMRTLPAHVATPISLATGASLVGLNGPPAGAYNGIGGPLFFSLDMPPGSVLRQLDCYGFGVGAATGGSWFLIGYDAVGNASNLESIGATAGPGAVQKTFAGLNRTVGPNSQFVADLSGTFASYYAVGVTYQFVPPTPGFHPIAPARVYDSRFNSPTGIVAAGGNRLISVANAYNPGTNVVSITDVVPAGAVAVAYNLTVTDTSAAGFVQLTPGGASAVTGSSINFAAGQTIANGGVVSLDSTRHVKAFAVASNANVILDVQGYYL